MDPIFVKIAWNMLQIVGPDVWKFVQRLHDDDIDPNSITEEQWDRLYGKSAEQIVAEVKAQMRGQGARETSGEV